jgi:hypothetical protein
MYVGGPFGIFYDHLVYFMAFGIFDGHLVYFMTIYYAYFVVIWYIFSFCIDKIWQACFTPDVVKVVGEGDEEYERLDRDVPQDQNLVKNKLKLN